MGIKVFFNNSCSICRMEINHYKKISNSNLEWIDITNNDDALKFHPTQKPIGMIEYFVKTYSDEGDVILDNCMGSGSTVIACRNINRQYIGIEKDPEYFKKALEWIKSYNRIDPFVTDEEVSHDTNNPLLNALY